MNPAARYIRIVRDLPLDPAHGLKKHSVWRVGTPPQGASTMKTWVISDTGNPVALLAHEFEEIELKLARCPRCQHEAKLVRSAKRGHWIVECGEGIDCPVWPMTSPAPGIGKAAADWNLRRFARGLETSAAHAE